LPPETQCLFWLREWEIWQQNWHLYYRLKESYGNKQLLHEVPGHLFLDYEIPDLATYLQVSVSNGWGGYILSGYHDYVSAFFSHDEYIDFHFDEESSFEQLRAKLCK